MTTDFLPQLGQALAKILEQVCPGSRTELRDREMAVEVVVWCPCAGGILQENLALTIFVDEPLHVVTHTPLRASAAHTFCLADPDFLAQFLHLTTTHYQAVDSLHFRMLPQILHNLPGWLAGPGEGWHL